VWRAVGRATHQVSGTVHASFLGETYAIPEVAWESFPHVLTAELEAGWHAQPSGADEPFCILVSGPTQVFFLTSTRVTTHDGVARRLVLDVG
jgi:hypothetical protein